MRRKEELFAAPASLEEARRSQSALGRRMARPCLRRAEAGGQAAAGRLFEPGTSAGPGLLVYLHGGGFVSGDGEYAQSVALVLAAKLGRRVCCVPYRLAPDWPFPAALEDARAAYEALLAGGADPAELVLVGDSSGGGLALSLLLDLRDAGRPLPAGLIAISPWADLTLTAPSLAENREEDPLFSPALLGQWAALYAAGADPADPALSPLWGGLGGLPPALLFAGEKELLRDDAVRLHRRLRDAGVEADLTVAPGMWHCYPLSGVREAREDFRRMDRFLRRLLPEEGAGEGTERC